MTIEILRATDVSDSPMVRRARAAVADALGEPVPECTVLLGSRALAACILSPNYWSLSGAREWLSTWWGDRRSYGQTITCAGGEDPVVMVHTTSRQHLWPTLVHELVHVVQAGRPDARRDDTINADEDEAYRIEHLITTGAQRAPHTLEMTA
ncbi:hypothetical protein [Streptantibioticus silvisoli]|uniref:Uncharacterized protein n=1 Tax=Streptantibioticus silvisoli TaxID=2705255 RepID=A0ABT6W267_9ACTN|nr:hypothetical protein [Streptantibioticus silvisoli]MDI5964841.1 hypothetical protein [Streptantibioticus silvisoli]